MSLLHTKEIKFDCSDRTIHSSVCDRKSSKHLRGIRYDNTQHHKKLNLPTYPNYKHDGSEENVMSSPAPMLLDVLQEIAARVESSLQIERKINSYRRLWWFASPKSDSLALSDRQSPYAELG